VKDTIVLAYSGGLDTSVALRWLADEYDADVIALLIDVGQGIDAEAVTARALAAGAGDVEVIDAREEFATDYVLPVLQAGALYEGRYPLVSALSRPLIGRHLVAVARARGATAVAHGCTGKGNDQVRFDVTFQTLDRDLQIIAPVREWKWTRDEELKYAEKHKPSVDAEHHLFCSEWVATVYKRLGLGDLNGIDFDPKLATPVGPLARPELFAEPVYLESEDPTPAPVP